MKRRFCVKSMALGAGIMLIGMWVSPLISPPITAQHNGVFNEIQCRMLTVLNKQGKPAVRLVSSEIFGNKVIVLNNMGKLAVELGSIAALEKDAQKNEMVNWVTVLNKQGKPAVELASTEYGGRVDVFNNQGKNRATMQVNEYGNGAVSTWDKNGYR